MSADTPLLRDDCTPEERALHLSLPQDEVKGLMEKAAQRAAMRSSERPRGAWYLLMYIFLQAMAYFGTTSILALYFHNHLGVEEEDAVEYTHLFISSTFFFSLIGGWLSDAYLGKYRLIWWALVSWVTGGALLIYDNLPTITSPPTWLPILALGLVAAGKGAATPCNGSLLGDQFHGRDPALAASTFAWLYWAVSIGSVLARYAAPALRSSSGYFAAFAMLGSCVFLGYFFFEAGRPHYRITPPSSNPIRDMYVVIRASSTRPRWCSLPSLPSWCCFGRSSPTPETADETAAALPPPPKAPSAPGDENKHWLDVAKALYGEELVDDVKQALAVLLVLLPLPFFWTLNHQTYSTWVFQAESMNRRIFGTVISPDQPPVLSPIFQLLLIPVFDKWLYPFLSACGMKPSALKKVGFGMLMCASSFILAGLVQVRVDANPVSYRGDVPSGGISIIWQIPQLFVMAMGEVFVGVNGLDFAYTEAPACMKSVMTAFWYFTVGVGNMLAALMSNIDIDECYEACWFFVYGSIMIACIIPFMILSIRYKYINSGKSDYATDPLEKTEIKARSNSL